MSGITSRRFRLRWENDRWLGGALTPSVYGKQRPTIVAVSAARNGDVFKIVRQNGDFSYQVPFDGKIFNLKQFGDLSEIGVDRIEPLRTFLEHVEAEVFEKIVNDTTSRLGQKKRHWEQSSDRLARWSNNEFWVNEEPEDTLELHEMVAAEEQSIRESPARIRQYELLLEWLEKIDSSQQSLRLLVVKPVAYPSASDNATANATIRTAVPLPATLRERRIPFPSPISRRTVLVER